MIFCLSLHSISRAQTPDHDITDETPSVSPEAAPPASQKTAPSINKPTRVRTLKKSDSANDPSLDISRLSYFAHQNNFQIYTRLIYPFENSIDALATRARVQVETNTSTNSVTFDTGVGYGITNWLRVGITENFLLSSGSFTRIPPATTYGEVYSQGPSDPIYSITCRFLDPHSLGLSADISLSVSPSSGNHFLGEPGQFGDNYRGFATSIISLPAYFSQRANDIGLAVSATQNSAGGATGSTLANSYTKTSSVVYGASIIDRLHFSWFYLQGELDVNMPYTTQQTNGVGVVKTINLPAIVSQKYLAGFRLNSRAALETELTVTEYNLSSTADDGTSTSYEQKSSNFILQLRFGF